MYTETLTQSRNCVNSIKPQTLSGTRDSTGGVDMANFKRAFFRLVCGTITGGDRKSVV